MAVGDYVWVTKNSNNKLGPNPMLYSTIKEAEDAAKIWGPLAKIAEYEVDLCA